MSQHVAKIGQYQLENLLKNSIGFVFLDLRSEEKRATEAPGHALLTGSVPVAPENVLSFLLEKGIQSNAPIVLICESGSTSMALARDLEIKSSFINVFVVEGGTASLDFNQT